MIARALHCVEDAALTALSLLELPHPLRDGLMTRLTPEPEIRSVRIPGTRRELSGDLYRRRAGGPRGGLVLVHGLTEAGKDDPRIVWLGRLMARLGFAVLVPEFPGLRAMRARDADVEEIGDSVRYLASLGPVARGDRIGLAGFSYVAGPTLIAAADPAIADRVSLVVSVGGYYDLVNVIRFITTGHFAYREVRGWLPPNQVARWGFLQSNLELLRDPRDRRILETIAQARAAGAAAGEGPPLDGLSPWGRALYGLLTNEDPDRVASLIDALDPELRAQIAFLSPARVVGRLRADLVIVHGAHDDCIPYTESLRLAEAAPERSRVRLLITRRLAHMDVVRPPRSPWRLPDLPLAEAWRLARVIWFVLAQHR
jgi:dienelactone hydrolase